MKNIQEPRIIAELRKFNEQDDVHFKEDAQLMKTILLSQPIATNKAIMTAFEQNSESGERVAALGDFVLNNSPEFKERMREYMRSMHSRMARLFSNEDATQGFEVQAWIEQERDRIEEKREIQRVKQEKAYADIQKISVAELRSPNVLQDLLTPEIVEQVFTYYIATLNQEMMMGMLQ